MSVVRACLVCMVCSWQLPIVFFGSICLASRLSRLETGKLLGWLGPRRTLMDLVWTLPGGGSHSCALDGWAMTALKSPLPVTMRAKRVRNQKSLSFCWPIGRERDGLPRASIEKPQQGSMTSNMVSLGLPPLTLCSGALVHPSISIQHARQLLPSAIFKDPGWLDFSLFFSSVCVCALN